LKTILVSAGDVSGEAHAAELVRAIRQRRPDTRFVGMGGAEMSAAGVELVVDQRELAVGGILEVATSLGRLFRSFWRMLACVRREKPDLIVLVDSGGFHLPLAWLVKRIVSAPILYYVPPQVWAWRSHRLEKLASRADRIAVILPFEREYYAERGVDVDFVGHPVLDRIQRVGSRRAQQGSSEAPGDEGPRSRLGLDPEIPVLALLPGSRRNELERHLPLQLEAFRRLRAGRPTLRAIVALATSLEADAVEAILSRAGPDLSGLVDVVRGQTEAVIDAADVALAKPGTITVELMLRGCPMVVIGRVHPWTAWIVRRSIGLDWLSMPNLVAGEEIVPELMQEDATPDRIAAALAPLFEGPERIRQIEGLARTSRRLGEPGAAQRTSAIVEEMLATPGT
jgi:lipid-A-disaccharide synthase